MLFKLCSHCGKMIPYGKTYCTECEKEYKERMEAQKKEYKRAYDRDWNKRKRDPKYVRFYNSKDWRILSAKYTADKAYRCEECGAIATQVHHKQAIQTDEGWARRLDYSNLELLCTSCHNKRHDRFKKKKNKEGTIYPQKSIKNVKF